MDVEEREMRVTSWLGKKTQNSTDGDFFCESPAQQAVKNRPARATKNPLFPAGS
jgi:hypothetical protein